MQLEMPPKLLTQEDLVILQMLLCSKLNPGIKELSQAWIPKQVPTRLLPTSVVKLLRTFQTRPKTKHAMAAIGP